MRKYRSEFGVTDMIGICKAEKGASYAKKELHKSPRGSAKLCMCRLRLHEAGQRTSTGDKITNCQKAISSMIVIAFTGLELLNTEKSGETTSNISGGQ